MTIHVGISGAAGRMGKTLTELLHTNNKLTLTVAVEAVDNSLIGADSGTISGVEANKVLLCDDLEKNIEHLDILIDFSLAQSVKHNIKLCQQYGKALVIGTTGLSEADKADIVAASAVIPIVFAPNMSIGVNLCLKLLAMTAEVIGDDADIDIIEAHHRNKVDAPSGTAIKMGQVIAETLDYDLDECATYGKQGITGVRDKHSIDFETIRAGDIVGDHTVMFSCEGERIEISHKASSRKTFARGALHAAEWLANKSAGLYDMQDVLGLKE